MTSDGFILTQLATYNNSYTAGSAAAAYTVRLYRISGQLRSYIDIVSCKQLKDCK